MTTVIIDADILAYQVGCNNEDAVEWDDDQWSVAGDMKKAKREVHDALKAILKKTGADTYALCLTDSAGNFRRTVFPDYKGNRKGTRPPFLLKVIKDWMIEELGAYLRPHLEGDDVIGILATAPKALPDKDRIIFSADKDLRQIPGKHWDGRKIIEVTPEEGERFFYQQVLTGDPTDGYGGCPGVGKVAAEKILDDPRKLEKVEREIARGKRKGTLVEDWVYTDPCDIWTAICCQYERAELTEADALVQARCARILRHGEYNYQTKEPILWSHNSSAG